MGGGGRGSGPLAGKNAKATGSLNNAGPDPLCKAQSYQANLIKPELATTDIVSQDQIATKPAFNIWPLSARCLLYLDHSPRNN